MTAAPIGAVGARLALTPIATATIVADVPRFPSGCGGDLAMTMSIVQSFSREMRLRNGITQASSAMKKQEMELAAAREAEEKARQAQEAADEKSKRIGTLKTIATIAAAVGGAAATVCTAGIGAPLAVAAVGLALSMSSGYIAEKTGSENLGLACSLVGTGLTLVATLGASAPAALGTAGTAVKIVGQTANLVAADVRVGQGACEARRGDDLADAQHAQADAKGHFAEVTAAKGDLDEAAELLQKIERSHRRALAAVLGISTEIAETRKLTIQGIGRRV